MTKAEREARAVAEHRCPRCHMREHFRCRRNLRHSVVYINHPHQERIALVRED